MKYNIDRLYESVKTKGHVCVGLDTCIDYVPLSERNRVENNAQAVLSFNKAVIDATSDVAACYKVQIAYYEEMGIEGLKAYRDTLKYIKSKDCLVIADIKRGDIADTALRYAKAHFSGDFEADFVTLNPYMGMDSIQPWINEASSHGKGAFVLMRTSNQGMKDFEYLEIKSAHESSRHFLYDAVGKKISALSYQYKGNYGYGMFGVVVGCTPSEKDEALNIRINYPDLFFLIPGYGAQGGGPHDVALLLRDKNGGIVNASRSIINAWQNQDKREEEIKNADNSSASLAARNSAVKMRDEIFQEINKNNDTQRNTGDIK